MLNPLFLQKRRGLHKGKQGTSVENQEVASRHPYDKMSGLPALLKLTNRKACLQMETLQLEKNPSRGHQRPGTESQLELI